MEALESTEQPEQDSGTEPQPAEDEAEPHFVGPTVGARRQRGLCVGVLVLVGLVAGGALGLALHVDGLLGGRTFPSLTRPHAGSPPSRADAGVPTAGTPGGRTVSAPLDGRRDLRFGVLTEATRVTVRSADLGGRLYTATASDGSAVPRVTDRGDVIALQLVRTGQSGSDSVDIQLNSRLRWTVELGAPAAEHVVDMRAGGLAGIEVRGGASRVELSLPAPDGTVPVLMAGGVSELVVHAPTGVPVRVRVGSGARSATIDKTEEADVPAGTVFVPPEWAAAAARYDIDTTALVSALRLDRG